MCCFHGTAFGITVQLCACHEGVCHVHRCGHSWRACLLEQWLLTLAAEMVRTQ